MSKHSFSENEANAARRDAESIATVTLARASEEFIDRMIAAGHDAALSATLLAHYLALIQVATLAGIANGDIDATNQMLDAQIGGMRMYATKLAEESPST